MTNKELTKGLFEYTYIDIQKILQTYRLLNVYIENFKKEYEQEYYESDLSALMNNKVVNSYELQQ